MMLYDLYNTSYSSFFHTGCITLYDTQVRAMFSINVRTNTKQSTHELHRALARGTGAASSLTRHSNAQQVADCWLCMTNVAWTANRVLMCGAPCNLVRVAAKQSCGPKEWQQCSCYARSSRGSGSSMRSDAEGSQDSSTMRKWSLVTRKLAGNRDVTTLFHRKKLR